MPTSTAKPILISAGGTGGGVYPAVSVAEALRRVAPDTPRCFIGSVGGMERDLVPRDLFAAYREVLSGPLNGVGLRRAAISAIKLLIGMAQSWRLIGQIHPSALFLTGGWATFPAALAAWLRRVPVAIFLPDIEPALAIKWLSRLSRLIMATTVDSARYFPSGTAVAATGYPLRSEILQATRAAALARFELDPDRKTLLVFGGSRGSRNINEALATCLPDLLADGRQVLHVSGELDWPTVSARRERLSAEEKRQYHAFGYLHSADMGLALAAADLAVSRAGASALGELPYFGLPAILVPLAFAWRYQRVNADWLAARGAAVRLDDGALKDDLLPAIRALFGDPARLEAMHHASLKLARPDAAAAIAQKIIGLA